MSKYIYIAVCILTIVFVVFIRLHLSHMPLERDEGEFAYAGQLITQGIPPYQEVWNMKFPGAYYIYAASFELFGETVAAPRYLTLILQLVSAGFIFLFAKRIIDPMAGWMCAAAFMVFNLSPALFGELSKAEHFLVAFLVPAIYFLYRGTERKSFFQIFISGMLVALACIMKQHAFIFGVAGAVWVIYIHRIKSIPYLLMFAAGGALPALIMVIYLIHVGVWDRFYLLTILYARAYVGLAHYAQGAINLFNFLITCIKGSPVLFLCTILSVVGLVRAPALSDPKNRMFLIVLFLVSCAGVFPGMYFRRHYFLIMTPAFALIATYSAFLLYKKLETTWRYATLSMIIAVNVIFFAFFERNNFFILPLDQVVARVYPFNPFAITDQVAYYIKAHSNPNDRICSVGQEPQIFFISQRKSASGYIYLYPLFEEQKYADKMTDEFIAQSEEKHPKFLIYSSYSTFAGNYKHDSKLFRWLLEFKKGYKLTAINLSGPEIAKLDTIAPVDTASMSMAQIAVYQRIDK